MCCVEQLVFVCLCRWSSVKTTRKLWNRSTRTWFTGLASSDTSANRDSPKSLSTWSACASWSSRGSKYCVRILQSTACGFIWTSCSELYRLTCVWFQEEAGSSQQEGGAEREEERGEWTRARRYPFTWLNLKGAFTCFSLFVGESSDRCSAGQRHREGAAGETQTGNGTTLWPSDRIL